MTAPSAGLDIAAPASTSSQTSTSSTNDSGVGTGAQPDQQPTSALPAWQRFDGRRRGRAR